MRSERELTGALLCLIDIAPTAQFAAERDGLLEEGSLLAATVGAAADLIAFVAEDEVGPEASLLCTAGVFGNGGLRGLERGIVGARRCQKLVESERGTSGRFGEGIGFGGAWGCWIGR